MDTNEFSGFYEAWFDRVYNYARHRTGSAVRADEIASETFSRVLHSWGKFDPQKGDRQTWLFSIAFRCVADHYRSLKRSGASLDAVPEPHDKALGPAQEAEREHERLRLMGSLASLEEQAREIVTLRFYAGLTNRAIAQLVGLSESNVGVILFRSVRRMRKDLTGAEA
jgi:RNA polymerase sigma factor (sigma-70 family)